MGRMVSKPRSEARFYRGCAGADDTDVAFRDSSHEDVVSEPRLIKSETLDFGKMNSADDTSQNDADEMLEDFKRVCAWADLTELQEQTRSKDQSSVSWISLF